MDALERKFEQELVHTVEQQQLVCGWNPVRFLQGVSKYGAVSAVKRLIARGTPSESLERLAELGRLELSLEALAVKKEYAPLFTDDEVNACFDSLCAYGYYGS